LSNADLDSPEYNAFVLQKLKAIEALPAEKRIAADEAIKRIMEDARDIGNDIEEEERAARIDARLAAIRRTFYKDVRSTDRRRILELADSLVSERLDIPLEAKKKDALVTELLQSFDKLNGILDRARLAGVNIPEPTPIGTPGQREAYRKAAVAATVQTRLELERARRQSLNPIRYWTRLIKLEVGRRIATLFRLGSAIIFGMAIFLMAGFVHQLHVGEHEWYAGFILVPIAVAAIELLIHRFFDSYFEKWARRDQLKLNLLITKNRLDFAVSEALLEQTREINKSS